MVLNVFSLLLVRLIVLLVEAIRVVLVCLMHLVNGLLVLDAEFGVKSCQGVLLLDLSVLDNLEGLVIYH